MNILEQIKSPADLKISINTKNAGIGYTNS